MSDVEFDLVFQKLAEAKRELLISEPTQVVDFEELIGIEELSRLSAAMIEPEVRTFTTGSVLHVIR